MWSKNQEMIVKTKKNIIVNFTDLNYRKMNSFNFKYCLGCQENEDQYYIFENFTLINTEKEKIRLDSIFEDIGRQKEAIGRILIIESNRLKMKEALQSQPEGPEGN